MQSRDYLKKQFEQISKAIAQSLANVLKIKFDTIEVKQHTIENIDNQVIKILNANSNDFETQIENLPAEALQNLSLLLVETSSINNTDNLEKIDLINTLLASKHNTLDFNHFLRNS